MVSLLLAGLMAASAGTAMAQAAGAGPATEDASAADGAAPTAGRVRPAEPASPSTGPATGAAAPGSDTPAGGETAASPAASDGAATPAGVVDADAAAGTAPAGVATDDAAADNAGNAADAGTGDATPVLFEEPRDEKLPHDLSPLGMFLAADWVVKSVMIGLALASLATWTILLVKGFEVFSAKWRARAGVRRLAKADSLRKALGDERSAARWGGPVGRLARSAAGELERSAGLSADGVKERVAIGLSRIEANAARSLNRGTGLLATIGSIAPFVGLFGTVWGIMNSFIGISEANTTNLAVVAPGIAEALLATAIGLVAAIPAVVIYNVFARSIAGYRAILSDATALVMQHLSRDLERGATAGRDLPLAQAAE
ncbi:MotA/TolQ/ExbB proton channel [Aurantimonas sp. 22II-16-19i]|nr:MotA/TolQ/ExbB proton channel [Aurantimonas sp. 22II-16-19i]